MPATRGYFEVPALIEDGIEVVPAVQMGRVLQFRKDNIKGEALRAVDYLKRVKPPTLAEEHHAYFSTVSGKPMAWSYDEKAGIYVPERPDDFLCKEFRKSVADTRGKGEWVSTLKQPRQPKAGETVPQGYAPMTLINFNKATDRVWFDKKADVWRIEYDSKNAFDILEPANGWTLLYVTETGYPEKTSQNRKEAEQTFGADASHFYADRNDLRAVLRGHLLGDDGPFYVAASCGLVGGPSDIGARSCRSSVEQGSKNLATPQKSVYKLSGATYSATFGLLEKLATGDGSIKELQNGARDLKRRFEELKPRK